MAEMNEKFQSGDSLRNNLTNNVNDSDDESEREFARHVIASAPGEENLKKSNSLSAVGDGGSIPRQSPVRTVEPVKKDSPSGFNSKPDVRDCLNDKLSGDDDDDDVIIKLADNNPKPNSSPPQSRQSPTGITPKGSRQNSPVESGANALTRDELNSAQNQQSPKVNTPFGSRKSSPVASEENILTRGGLNENLHSPKTNSPSTSRKSSPVENEANVSLTRGELLNDSREFKPMSPFRSHQSPVSPNARSAVLNVSRTGSVSRRSPSSLFSDRVFVEGHFALNEPIEDSLEDILRDARNPNELISTEKNQPKKSSPSLSPTLPRMYADSSEDENDIIDGSTSKTYPFNKFSPRSQNGNQSLNNSNNSANKIFSGENKLPSPRIKGDDNMKRDEQEPNVDEESLDADDADFREIFTHPFVNRYRQPFDFKFMASVTAWASEDLAKTLKHLREKRELIVERQKRNKTHQLSSDNKSSIAYIDQGAIPRDYMDGDDLWSTECDAIMSAINLSSIKPRAVMVSEEKDWVEIANDSYYNESPLISLENNAIRELISRRQAAVSCLRRTTGCEDELTRPIHGDSKAKGHDQKLLLLENIALWRSLAKAHKDYAARLEVLQADSRKQASLIKRLKSQIDFFEKEMSALERKCHRIRRSY